MNEYQKGRCDRRAGLYPEDNPHDKGSKEWRQWQAGYEDELIDECIDEGYCSHEFVESSE